jgi:hypothetical protein
VSEPFEIWELYAPPDLGGIACDLAVDEVADSPQREEYRTRIATSSAMSSSTGSISWMKPVSAFAAGKLRGQAERKDEKP